MPLLVNGELIPKELIREEERRLAQLPEWQEIPDGVEKGMRLREAAEQVVVDRILLRQVAERDRRPLDPVLVERHVQRLRTDNGCRVVFDDGPLRGQIEGQLRLERTLHDLMGLLPQPTDAQIASFYKAQRRSFQSDETVHAAHILKNVDETHPEEEARAGIEAALAELQRGEPFAVVAERYSDCKGNGGDLGTFPRGLMVEEFDDVVFALKAGERSPIFRTPFGFHIVEVVSKTPAGVLELREVKDTIARFLMSMLEQEGARRVAGALRARANIRRISTREAEALALERVAG